MAATREWLDSLKPGDYVAWSRHGRSWNIAKVHSRNKVHIFTVFAGSETRWSARHGSQGSGWDRVSLQPVTDDIRRAVKRERMLAKLENTRWADIDADTLAAAYALVLKAKMPGKPDSSGPL